jgi:hypothetical protein
MDEQMIELVRDAIDRNVTWQTGEVFKGNRQCVNYLEVARAAHSVIAVKVAERDALLLNTLTEAERLLDRRLYPRVALRLREARAALAPHPKARNE